MKIHLTDVKEITVSNEFESIRDTKDFLNFIKCIGSEINIKDSEFSNKIFDLNVSDCALETLLRYMKRGDHFFLRDKYSKLVGYVSTTFLNRELGPHGEYRAYSQVKMRGTKYSVELTGTCLVMISKNDSGRILKKYLTKYSKSMLTETEPSTYNIKRLVEEEQITSECLTCKKVFSTSGKSMKWCSLDCQDNSNYIAYKQDTSNDNEYGHNIAPIRVCTCCKRLFHSNHKSLCFYCSTNTKRKGFLKNCKNCGLTHVSASPDETFCSAECEDKAYPKNVLRSCIVCKRRFMGLMEGSKVCKPCAIEIINKRDRNKDKNKK